MLEDLRKEKLAKLEKIKNAKLAPYPARVKRDFPIAKTLEKFEELSKSQKSVSLVGRIMGSRDQGGVMFLDLKDESGQIQLVLKNENLENFELWKSLLDRGDFIAIVGPLFTTKRGEKSVEVKSLEMASKSLLPLPTEWYGIEEVETRYRKRYLDLLINKDTQEIFRKKNVFWQTLRDSLRKQNFLEVETPVLETTPGGAEAEPFVTHHNALDTDFYLRISLELPLKKLLVGGYEAVFEIGRIFRNEGIDKEHLQDYTQLEFYWAYRDYNDCMKLTEKMYKAAIKKVTGGLETTWNGQKIDWGKKWPKVKYAEEFKKTNGIDPAKASRDELFKKAQEIGLKPEAGFGKGRLIDLIYKKTMRSKLVQPVFLIDPPVEIEPLAKRSEKNSALVERFQIVACGTELGKGFSELNDPIDQRARFEEQMKLRAAGDTEAQMLDESFLEALEYGMPPAAGFGMSERLFAVLLDKPVRETVIFPLMRPEKKDGE